MTTNQASSAVKQIEASGQGALPVVTDHSDSFHTLTSSDHVNHEKTRSEPNNTTSSDSTDRSACPSSNPEKLSSADFIELTRISRKKDDIEQHIASLQSWPDWDPFKNVSSYSADIGSLQYSRETLNDISSSLRDRQDKCNRLENDVQQFNLEDMKRLRAVAKAVSKRHLSGPDTDLLELALETVYALDRLLRLLRERRTEHDLTELRLQWEAMVCSSWEDVEVLRRDIDAFEHKCEALIASRLNKIGALDPKADRREMGKGEGDALASQNRTNKRRSSSSTQSSLKLATESVMLEASRLVLRIKSFDSEKVRPAGRILDLLIDQRQVPEKLIDEQEKLEDALPQPSTIEARSSQISTSLGQSTFSTPEARGKSAPETLDSRTSLTAPILRSRDVANRVASTAGNHARIQPCAQGPSRNHHSDARSRKTSASSMRSVPSRHASNRYQSNPRDALDVAVGKIVNGMSMSISIKSANFANDPVSQRSSTSKDLSGQYWIGDPDPRLCFCRILPSSMVMVRVGGGWQELSEFLTQHYAHLSLTGAHANAPMTNGSKPQSNLTWLRSASGPVASPRLRSKSSVGLLRSQGSPRLGTRLSPSRIVTMPTPGRDLALLSTDGKIPRNTTDTTLKHVSVEIRDRSFSTPCKTSNLPSSGSASSIIIHPSPPST